MKYDLFTEMTWTETKRNETKPHEINWNKQVLAAREHVPHAYYKYFMDSLLDTVRDGIAECSEV